MKRSYNRLPAVFFFQECHRHRTDASTQSKYKQTNKQTNIQNKTVDNLHAFPIKTPGDDHLLIPGGQDVFFLNPFLV